MEKIPLLIIGGPTASGKTGLAVALAKRFEGEIVSADSMQIYKDISIGTARASEDELDGVPIHLSGFLPLDETYSAARYVEDAGRAIADIHSRGKLPILCGGTGLYISSLIDNIKFSGTEPDQNLRAQLMETPAEQLMEKLRSVDPESAERLNISDKKRIARALEVYMQTGVTITEHNRLSKLAPSNYDVCYICLNFEDRELLYGRCDSRVDAMLAAGLLDEARFVLRSGGRGTVMQAIGYKEFLPYFDGTQTLCEAVEILKRDTRRYAKRQLTWLRRDERVQWIYIDRFGSFDEITAEAERIFTKKEEALK